MGLGGSDVLTFLRSYIPLLPCSTRHTVRLAMKWAVSIRASRAGPDGTF